MGTRCRPHDSRDCEQWNALLALVTGCCGFGARHCHYCFPRRIWAVHGLDLNPIQAEASRGQESLGSCEIFFLIWLTRIDSTQHG